METLPEELIDKIKRDFRLSISGDKAKKMSVIHATIRLMSKINSDIYVIKCLDNRLTLRIIHPGEYGIRFVANMVNLGKNIVFAKNLYELLEVKNVIKKYGKDYGPLELLEMYPDKYGFINTNEHDEILIKMSGKAMSILDTLIDLLRISRIAKVDKIIEISSD